MVPEREQTGQGRAVIRPVSLVAIVVAFVIGCASLVMAGCAGVRSEAPKEQEQGRAEATEEKQESTEAAGSAGRPPGEDRCKGTHTFDVLKKQGIDYISDSSVKPGDPEALRITNDAPGCPSGGLLSGTDKPDRLAGGDGEDEVRGLGAADRFTGGPGPDVVYGGLAATRCMAEAASWSSNPPPTGAKTSCTARRAGTNLPAREAMT